MANDDRLDSKESGKKGGADHQSESEPQITDKNAPQPLITEEYVKQIVEGLRPELERLVKKTMIDQQIAVDGRWRWGVRIGEIIAIAGMVLLAYLCFRPIVSILGNKAIDDFSVWVFVISGLYMVAVVMAGIFGIISVLKED